MYHVLLSFWQAKAYNLVCSTIEVMYLSFRRSQHALLALSFFVVMVLVVFSTLLYVILFSILHLCLKNELVQCSYFAERGTWDEVLGTFINSDGDPSQFAVRFFLLGLERLTEGRNSRFLPPHGKYTWFLLILTSE